MAFEVIAKGMLWYISKVWSCDIARSTMVIMVRWCSGMMKTTVSLLSLSHLAYYILNRFWCKLSNNFWDKSSNTHTICIETNNNTVPKCTLLPRKMHSHNSWTQPGFWNLIASIKHSASEPTHGWVTDCFYAIAIFMSPAVIDVIVGYSLKLEGFSPPTDCTETKTWSYEIKHCYEFAFLV